MKKTLLVAALTVANIAPVYSDQHEETLVTATRTEQTHAETLASVTIFTREDIDKFQVSSLAQLLGKAAGISVTRNGGRGAATGLSLRGNQTDHTLFLVDGIRVGSATLGSTPVELIDPELIERVEIVRGPKSSLYGSDALGGVINIITRKASTNNPLIVKAGFGNNDTRDFSINVGQRTDKIHTNFSASSIYTGGIDNTSVTNLPNADDDAFRQQTLGFNGGIDLTKDLSLSMSYQLVEAESEFDTNCTDSTDFSSVICTPYSENETKALNVAADWAITSLWNTSLSLGSSKDESEILGDDVDLLTTFSGGEFNTKKTDINWQNNFQLHKNVLAIVGYDYLKEEVNGTTDYDVDERDNDGYYAQLQWNHNKLSANVGTRHDENEQFGNFDTYNASLGFAISQDIKIITSYGEAFKAPTFNDLYFPGFGDPTAVPEETDTYEIALRGFTQKANWSIGVYQNNVENLLQFNSAIGTNDQIASATIEGAEITLESELAGWDINTALSYIDTEDDATGNELARRPDKTINIDIDRSFGQWSVGATFYASSSRFNDAANTSELNGYSTFSLRGAYNLSDEWKFQLKADNLFEKNYVLAQSSSLGDFQQPGLEVLFSVVYTPES